MQNNNFNFQYKYFKPDAKVLNIENAIKLNY